MSTSTRRSFMATAGAALSAPVAAAAATSPSWLPPSGGSGTLEARLAKLEDLNAIHALNQSLASDPSAIAREPGLFGVSLEDYGEHDVIEIAPDRQAATARLHVTLHTETEIGPECTVVEMARQQGNGVIRASERAVLKGHYVRRDGIWKIRDVERMHV